MKKSYNTPYLLLESFQLDSAVASCTVPLNQAADACYEKAGKDPDKYAGWFAGNYCYADAMGSGNDKPCYFAAIAGEGTFFAS